MREGKLRKFLAVILGVVVGNVIFFLVSIVSDRIYPTPPELLNPQTPESTALRVTTAEVNGLLLVLLGSALGAFFGGIIGAAIAKGKIVAVTSAIGGLLSPWAFYSFYVFYPARLWFPIGMLIAFLVSSYLGGLVVMQSQKEKTACK